MTQAYNLSQLANNLNASGQLDATDGLVNAVPVLNGGTGASTASAARANLGLGSLATANAINNDNWSGADLTVPNGGTGVSILSGVAYGNGTSAFTAATGAQIAAAIGTATVTNATNATNIGDNSVTSTKMNGGQTGTAPVFGYRAWVVFDGTNIVGTDCTILGSGNVASVYKNASGNFTITFTTALPNANYAINGATLDTAGSGGSTIWYVNATPPTTTSCKVFYYNSVYGPVNVARMAVSFIC